jgi:hypothetical protein
MRKSVLDPWDKAILRLEVSMRCYRFTLAFIALTVAALPVFSLFGSSGRVLAADAPPPACAYGGNTCKTCEKIWIDMQGNYRCIECKIDWACLKLKGPAFKSPVIKHFPQIQK